jgi:hypothetical protein
MKSAVILGTLVSVLALASPAQAQLCTLSYLSYIVRDANGTQVDAASKSFTFGGSADDRAWSQKMFVMSYSGFVTKMPTDLLSTLKDTITPPDCWKQGLRIQERRYPERDDGRQDHGPNFQHRATGQRQ